MTIKRTNMKIIKIMVYQMKINEIINFFLNFFKLIIDINDFYYKKFPSNLQIIISLYKILKS